MDTSQSESNIPTQNSINTVKKEKTKAKSRQNSIGGYPVNSKKRPPFRGQRHHRTSKKSKKKLPKLEKLMETSENAISEALKTLFISYTH